MILAILVGNTRTVAAHMEGLKVLRRKIVATPSLRSKSAAIRWARVLRRSARCEGILIASVVPPADPILKRSLRSVFGMTPEFVRLGRDIGIKVKVKKPFQVGADRLANAVAARELLGMPSIVVDYGTGTTFDVVDRKGAYCGGAILPGLGISLRALNDFTAKIPLVKFKKVPYAVGRTTEEAVRSGIYHGAIGTTRELLLRTRRQLGKKAPAVATGGWSWAFRHSGFFHSIEPDLTLKGMALIWRNLHA